MSVYNLYVNDINNPVESCMLVSMIINPEIEQIAYIWWQHSCQWSPYFSNTQWLRERKLAIVQMRIGTYCDVKNFLYNFNQLLAGSGCLEGVHGRVWAEKSDPRKILQCIC